MNEPIKEPSIDPVVAIDPKPGEPAIDPTPVNRTSDGVPLSEVPPVEAEPAAEPATAPEPRTRHRILTGAEWKAEQAKVKK